MQTMQTSGKQDINRKAAVRDVGLTAPAKEATFLSSDLSRYHFETEASALCSAALSDSSIRNNLYDIYIT